MRPDRHPDISWPPLYRGTLVRRYKRFLADILLDDGTAITAHCANSGAMTACADPGMPVWVSFHDNPKRKLKYTWEMIEMPASRVGVNTQVPNRLVARAIANQRIPELSGYAAMAQEVKTSEGTRLDLALSDPSRPTCYVEVKNCTLVEATYARFPDAVTTRGQKHLSELGKLANSGHRAVIFFLIQRMDAVSFSPADDIDPVYGKIFRDVTQNGVEAMAYDVFMDKAGISVRKPVPIQDRMP